MTTWTNKCYCCSAKYNSWSATLARNWDKHPTHTFSVLKPFFNEEKQIYQYKKMHFGFKPCDVEGGLSCMNIDENTWKIVYRDQIHFGCQSPQALSGTADSETSIVVTPWRVLGGGEIHIQAYRWYGDPVQVHVLFWGLFITGHHPSHTMSPFTTYMYWVGCVYYYILHGYLFTRLPIRSSVYLCPLRELNVCWMYVKYYIFLIFNNPIQTSKHFYTNNYKIT